VAKRRRTRGNPKLGKPLRAMDICKENNKKPQFLKPKGAWWVTERLGPDLETEKGTVESPEWGSRRERGGFIKGKAKGG